MNAREQDLIKLHILLNGDKDLSDILDKMRKTKKRARVTE